MSNHLNIAINPKLKNSAEALFKHMGLNLSTAVKMFLQQSVTDEAFPFQPHYKSYLVPDKDTREAMKELKHPNNLKSYSDVDAMFKDILK